MSIEPCLITRDAGDGRARTGRQAAAAPPQLAVVICAMGRPGAAAAVASVLASAAAGGVDIEVVLVWQAPHAPPAVPHGARVVPAFAVIAPACWVGRAAAAPAAITSR